MPSSLVPEKQLDARQAIDLLIKESRSRPVIPFLGSGFSFASGFPTITGVIEYLAKVDFAVHFDLFRHRYPQFPEGRNYKEHPSFFVEDFGWPSINALNAEIWNWLLHKTDEAKERFGRGHQLLLDIFGEAAPVPPGTEDQPLSIGKRHALTAIVQWSKRRVLAEKDSGTASSIQAAWDRWKAWYNGAAIDRPDLLGGDWDEMLERLCEGNLDLVDSLFTSFERGRSPTLAHRYLAFLTDKLCIPLILTTNFDSFLERAFAEEGIDHRVFDVHRDASLPHISLVKRQLSVMKLHGSAYGLRVGERLTYPVESETRESLLSYLPKESLIVVAGFSGSERRMTQILKTLATDRGLGERPPRMLWLEGPGQRRPMLEQLALEVGDQVKFVKITDISTFLQQAFFSYTGGYQSARAPYKALPGRPAIPPRQTKGQSPDDRKNERKPVQIFSTASEHSSWAGLRVAQFASERAKEGYSILWIDMEKHHTVPGTVAEILQQARVIDPESPTFSLFVRDDGQLPAPSCVKTVKRIHEILKRGRYVLVLDSLESYARPQFQHHGIPSYRFIDLRVDEEALEPSSRKRWTDLVSDMKAAKAHYEARIHALKEFLTELLCWNKAVADDADPFYDSYICLSIGQPSGRHDFGADTLDLMRQLTDTFRNSDGGEHVNVTVGAGDQYDDLKIAKSHDDDTHHLERCGSLPDDWRLKARSRSPAKGSRHFARLHDFLALKLRLRAIQKAEREEDRSHYESEFQRDTHCRSALIAMLAVFRRPRSIAFLRSMTERWLVGREAGASVSQLNAIRRAIDGLLDRQVLWGRDLVGPDRPFGMLQEGASIWLFREVQVEWYRSMTASLSVTKWIDGFFSRQPDKRTLADADIIAALIDGLICVSLHIDASRVYYADTFMPTQDLEAFNEYLYHRCWSIRALSLLQAILRAWPDADKPFKTFVERYNKTKNEILSSFRSRSCDLDLKEEGPLAELGVFSSIWDTAKEQSLTDAQTFRGLLEKLQVHCVQTLLGALHRQESFLLQHATPETLKGWLTQMKQIALQEMEGTLYEIFVPSPPGRSETTAAAFRDLKEFVEQLDARVGRKARGQRSNLQTANLEQVREAEVEAKAAQRDAQFLWSALDQPEAKRAWNLERTLGETQRREDLKEYYDARDRARKYEVVLRQAMRDSDLDARHRSCALALQARSEYLIGQFRQAQHRLDVAGGGLTDSPTHRASRSLIHAYRAELLIYSASDHYAAKARCSDTKLEWLDVMKELRKVHRADKEVRRASDLIHDAEHLTRWRSLWNLGVAQVQLEKLLFESEELFVRRASLNSREYSERSGRFEQTILDGLRALRTSLDELPFCELPHDRARENAERIGRQTEDWYFEFHVESKVWGLWRQFYVVAAYFDSLLNEFSKSPILTGHPSTFQGATAALLDLVIKGTESFNVERWKYWNQSVRFEEFSEIDRARKPGEEGPFLPETKCDLSANEMINNNSLLMVQTQVMNNDLGRTESQTQERPAGVGGDGIDWIQRMWDKRRPPTKKP